MAWELRSGRWYFYRSKRLGGEVSKIYLGAGEVARQAAKKDAAKKAKMAADRAELMKFQSTLADVDHLAAEVDQGVDLLTEGALLASGFHNHRGEWRCRRNVDSPR